MLCAHTLSIGQLLKTYTKEVSTPPIGVIMCLGVSNPWNSAHK